MPNSDHQAGASLSARGATAAATPLRIDYDAFRSAMENRYDATANPNGALPLNIAENRLSWFELGARIEESTRASSIPEWVPGYASTRGALEFREVAARFLASHLTHCLIDPDHLGVSAGATGVIEMTAFILAEPGDVAVIPAPCYPVYERDIGGMADVERYDLVTHHELNEISQKPVLSLHDLERAQRDIEASGRRFRMLILTSPDNPTGGLYSRDRLTEVAAWCVEREIHLVVNEIYGLSLIDTSDPELQADYTEGIRFESFAQVMAEEPSDYLHLWYALSKDLGISGFRLGLVYSRNAAFMKAYENLNLTHSVSNHTQWLLMQLLGDDDYVAGYVTRNRERLTASYRIAVESLRRVRIPYVPSRGSLFVWIDLSEFLTVPSEEGELELWNRLFEETGVLLTPGVGFGHSKRGLFRMVYPCVTPTELRVAMERLERWVTQHRS